MAHEEQKQIDSKRRIAALAGLYTLDEKDPRLIGARCVSCGTYFFPKQVVFCRNPECDGTQFQDVPLSRTGTVWSYTNACYRPPEPYVSTEPFEPFAIAAVELETEKMIVLGQVVKDVDVKQLRIGMKVELTLEALFADEESEQLVWKWKPVESAR